MRITFYLIFTLTLFMSCGADEATSVKKSATLDVDGNEVDISQFPVPDLEPLPEDSLSLYAERLSRIDRQILGKGPGITLRERDEITNELQVIQDEKVTLDRQCQVGGLYTFFMDDKLAFQAEVFLEDDCSYIVFYYKSQAKFANAFDSQSMTQLLN